MNAIPPTLLLTEVTLFLFLKLLTYKIKYKLIQHKNTCIKPQSIFKLTSQI